MLTNLPPLNIASKCRFFFVFGHLRDPKRSWKISNGGPGKVLDFFVYKRVGTQSLVKIIRIRSVTDSFLLPALEQFSEIVAGKATAVAE